MRHLTYLLAGAAVSFAAAVLVYWVGWMAVRGGPFPGAGQGSLWRCLGFYAAAVLPGFTGLLLFRRGLGFRSFLGDCALLTGYVLILLAALMLSGMNFYLGLFVMDSPVDVLGVAAAASGAAVYAAGFRAAERRKEG